MLHSLQKGFTEFDMCRYKNQVYSESDSTTFSTNQDRRSNAPPAFLRDTRIKEITPDCCTPRFTHSQGLFLSILVI